MRLERGDDTWLRMRGEEAPQSRIGETPAMCPSQEPIASDAMDETSSRDTSPAVVARTGSGAGD
eukprot:6829087-Pyramimonas_sp.AAC.1